MSSEDARDAYERALHLDPNHTDAHINLGRLLHEMRAPAAAEKHYRAALAMDPHHPIAAFNLGVALEDLGRTADAIDAYERAIAVDPQNADAHYNLAGLYEKRGDKADAVRETLRGAITAACPASILRTHASATLYIDDAAAGKLTAASK